MNEIEKKEESASIASQKYTPTHIYIHIYRYIWRERERDEVHTQKRRHGRLHRFHCQSSPILSLSIDRDTHTHPYIRIGICYTARLRLKYCLLTT